MFHKGAALISASSSLAVPNDDHRPCTILYEKGSPHAIVSFAGLGLRVGVRVSVTLTVRNFWWRIGEMHWITVSMLCRNNDGSVQGV